METTRADGAFLVAALVRAWVTVCIGDAISAHTSAHTQVKSSRAGLGQVRSFSPTFPLPEDQDISRPRGARFFAFLLAFLRNRSLDPFPFREVFAGYRRDLLRADLRAGVNVALLAFPQGLAYAAIADLPIVYGVTGSAVAALVAPLLTGSRHTILGPTNATSFMIFSFFATYLSLIHI